MTGKMRIGNRQMTAIHFGLLALFLFFNVTLSAQAEPGECLTEDEATLAQLMNEYRVEQGLEPIPVTVSLTAVAQWHVWDLDVNNPTGGECNLHSWSYSGPRQRQRDVGQAEGDHVQHIHGKRVRNRVLVFGNRDPIGRPERLEEQLRS